MLVGHSGQHRRPALTAQASDRHCRRPSGGERSSMRLLPNLLSRFVRNGRLTVVFEDGSRQVFGSGENGPDVTIRLTDKAVEREIFFNPELKAAEAYMDGRLLIENGGKVFDLLSLFSVN